MIRNNGLIVGLLAVSAMWIIPATPAHAEHLDKPEIRKAVRHVEEKADALQDRVDDWLADRPERLRMLEDFNHRIDRFESDLSQFKVDFLSKDEPWDLRDRVQTVMASADEVGRALNRPEFPPEMRHSWEDLRDQLSELARRYHLPEMRR